MAMARLSVFLVVLGILLVTDVSCVDPPTLAPVSGNDSPVSQPPIQNVEAPSPAAILTSPPSPPPSDDVSYSSPSPSPWFPSPALAPESDIDNGSGHVTEKSSPPSTSSSISSGKKAGIAVSVVIGVGLVGLGGYVYKERQDNIRRAQYGSYV